MSVPVPHSSEDVDPVIAAFRKGGPIVLIDDLGPYGGRGHLLIAGELADFESVGFMIRHSSGFICLALPEAEADRLDLPPLHAVNQTRDGVGVGVSVDARDGVSTGISAADRALTIRRLAAADSRAADFSRPGHIVIIRTEAGGVLTRIGPAEAAVDLARVAGLRQSVAMAVIVSTDNPVELAGVDELLRFSAAHGLARVRLSKLVDRLTRHDQHVVRANHARMPIEAATFTAIGYRNNYDDGEHVAFVLGDPADFATHSVLVRVQAECVLGDVFGSTRCGCRAGLEASLAAVATEGRGVVVYVRKHERSANGLLQKLAAYAVLDSGGTAVAHRPGGPVCDPRDARIAAQILLDLGIRRMRLLTSAPGAELDWRQFGLEVVEQ